MPICLAVPKIGFVCILQRRVRLITCFPVRLPPDDATAAGAESKQSTEFSGV